MSPPYSSNHDTVVVTNEATPLLVLNGHDSNISNTNDDASATSKVSSSIGSFVEDGNGPAAVVSATGKILLVDGNNSTVSFDQSIQQSIRTLRHNFVRAHSKLGTLIQQHTGSIGMLGSISIAVNSLTGPAMLNLPATFARSGIIPTISCLLFVCVLSSLCCLELSSIISKVPGNNNFKKEIEYSQAFSYFWGPRWFALTQALFLCCILCLNISSIVDMAQVVDTFLGHWCPNGGTAAVQIMYDSDGVSKQHLTYNWIRWDYTGCTSDDILDGTCSPFSYEPGLLITAGKILTVILYLPLALMDLKENAQWQVAAFFILIFCSVHFSIQFATIPGYDVGTNLSWWGHDWTNLFGVVLFNFALVIAVPAWLYERESHVHVPTVIHASSAMTFFLYVLIGVLGCAAIPNVSDNMLQSMLSGAFGLVMQISASVFAFAIIGLGIPLFSVLTRLNLTSSGLCSQSVGQLLAVYLPFTVAMFLYDGTDVTTLLSWGGVIFTSLVVFVLPLLLALHVTKEYFHFSGSIDVYCGVITTQPSQRRAQLVLIVLATLAVLCALIGNFYSVVHT